MTASMLRSRFDKAREDAGIPKSAFKLRDLRAKAGIDKAESSGDIMQARDQLGHTTVTMTERYARKRKGKNPADKIRIADQIKKGQTRKNRSSMVPGAGVEPARRLPFEGF